MEQSLVDLFLHERFQPFLRFYGKNMRMKEALIATFQPFLRFYADIIECATGRKAEG